MTAHNQINMTETQALFSRYVHDYSAHQNLMDS